jgi:hypothetical protein
MKESDLEDISVLTLDFGQEFLYLHGFRTKIDVTNKCCKGNCAFLDLFFLHNIVVGRA